MKPPRPTLSVKTLPPCQRWGRYWAGSPLVIARSGKRLKKGDDNGCFTAALSAVRRWGGVIEHPEGSHAWEHFNLMEPPRDGGWIVADWQGGWTCCVEQGQYGHWARKPTWLYACGIEVPSLRWGRLPRRLDPDVVARIGLKAAIKLGEVSRRGGGGKGGDKARSATPEPFRDLLLDMARSVRAERLAA